MIWLVVVANCVFVPRASLSGRTRRLIDADGAFFASMPDLDVNVGSLGLGPCSDAVVLSARIALDHGPGFCPRMVL